MDEDAELLRSPDPEASGASTRATSMRSPRTSHGARDVTALRPARGRAQHRARSASGRGRLVHRHALHGSRPDHRRRHRGRRRRRGGLRVCRGGLRDVRRRRSAAGDRHAARCRGRLPGEPPSCPAGGSAAALRLACRDPPRRRAPRRARGGAPAHTGAVRAPARQGLARRRGRHGGRAASAPHRARPTAVSAPAGQRGRLMEVYGPSDVTHGRGRRHRAGLRRRGGASATAPAGAARPRRARAARG